MPNPSTIVILTQAQDEHALLVSEALRRLGASVSLISHSSLPGQGNLAVGGDWTDPFISVAGMRFRTSQVRSFWNRRPPVGMNFPNSIHPADITHITDGFRSTISGIASLLDDRFPVNKQTSARITSNKLNQIRCAHTAGLRVPKTLVSNDVGEIASFFRSIDTMCMKPLSVYSWKSGASLTVTLTTRIAKIGMLDPQSAAVMPQIFQEFIPKDFEVRLTMFGKVTVATRINTAEGGEAAVDWRADQTYKQGLRRIEAPDDTIARCRTLMTILGLRFGSFDFVVTPDGEWVFMEVNQAGQFAWQERYNPASFLLEPFARYLIAASDDFTWDPSEASSELSYDSLSVEAFEGERYMGYWEEEFPNTDQVFADEDEVRPDGQDDQRRAARTI